MGFFAGLFLRLVFWPATIAVMAFAVTDRKRDVLEVAAE